MKDRRERERKRKWTGKEDSGREIGSGALAETEKSPSPFLSLSFPFLFLTFRLRCLSLTDREDTAQVWPSVDLLSNNQEFRHWTLLGTVSDQARKFPTSRHRTPTERTRKIKIGIVLWLSLLLDTKHTVRQREPDNSSKIKSAKV